MKKNIFIMSFCFYLIYFSCSSSLRVLDEPVENKCIIIGSAILDINGYQENFLNIKENIEIAVIGRVLENGREKVLGLWAETDENGYFSISNAPPGEYAIKGLRTHIIGIGDLNIANELIDPQRNYFELNDRSVIPFTGNLFDCVSNNRVINLEHNIFTVHAEGLVEFERFERLRQQKLSNGEAINRPPVPYYFLNQYQGGSWIKYLELQITH